MRSFGARGWGVTLVLALGFSSHARAASLRYEAPSECPDAVTLREEVERLLESALADAAPVEVGVQISQAGKDDFRVSLTLQAAGQEPRTRMISGRSCGEAADAAALAAAIALRARDPEAERADGSVPTGVAEQEPVKAAPSQSPAAPAPRAIPERRPTRFGLDASLLMDTATLPSLAVGLEAGGFAQFAGLPLRVMLFGGLLGRQEVQLSNGDGAKLHLLYAGLGSCAVKSFDSVFGLLCAGMELGSLRGEGTGSAPQLGSSLWLAPRVEVGLSRTLWRGLSLTARAGAAFPLIREAFVVGGEVIHRPASPTARVSAGLELLL